MQKQNPEGASIIFHGFRNVKNKVYERLRKHGVFSPAVLLSPNQIRRKSQISPKYVFRMSQLVIMIFLHADIWPRKETKSFLLARCGNAFINMTKFDQNHKTIIKTVR